MGHSSRSLLTFPFAWLQAVALLPSSQQARPTTASALGLLHSVTTLQQAALARPPTGSASGLEPPAASGGPSTLSSQGLIAAPQGSALQQQMEDMQAAYQQVGRMSSHCDQSPFAARMGQPALESRRSALLDYPSPLLQLLSESRSFQQEMRQLLQQQQQVPPARTADEGCQCSPPAPPPAAAAPERRDAGMQSSPVPFKARGDCPRAGCVHCRASQDGHSWQRWIDGRRRRSSRRVHVIGPWTDQADAEAPSPAPRICRWRQSRPAPRHGQLPSRSRSRHRPRSPAQPGERGRSRRRRRAQRQQGLPIRSGRPCSPGCRWRLSPRRLRPRHRPAAATPTWRLLRPPCPPMPRAARSSSACGAPSHASSPPPPRPCCGALQAGLFARA